MIELCKGADFTPAFLSIMQTGRMSYLSAALCSVPCPQVAHSRLCNPEEQKP